MSFYRRNQGYYPRYRNSDYYQPKTRYFGPKLYPQHQIAYETENHYGYINARIRPELQNNEGYKAIDDELFRHLGVRLAYIKYVHQDGHVDLAYSRPNSVALPVDSGNIYGLVQLTYANGGYTELIWLNLSSLSLNELKIRLYELYNKCFLDFGNNPVQFSYYATETGSELSSHMKKKGHSKYCRPHSESKSSPIEDIMENELNKQNIAFIKQYEIRVNDKKFTVIDFFIPNSKIAVYCDGTEFHKDPQRIIMDKQQDRILQSQGYCVLRFSGSEIVNDVHSCVREITKFIKRN